MDKIMEKFSWHPESNIKKAGFNEWVYFYFSSPKLHGIIIYGWAWRHPGVMSVQLFPVEENGRFGKPVLIDDYHVSKHEAERSSTNYDTRLGRCHLHDNPGGFNINGRLYDDSHDVSWDLSFSRPMEPIDAYKEPFGMLWFEYIGWKILSAPASVSGKVRMGKETLAIEGTGYVDTNYGRWLVAFDPATDWNWINAMDSDRQQAVIGMNIRSSPYKGALYYLSIAKQTYNNLPTKGSTIHGKAGKKPLTDRSQC